MRAGVSASEAAERKRAQARKLEQDAERWERGADGERQIAAVLAGLPADYVVFHDLRVPGSKANVDHLVVAPHGVFAIDTKNFSYAVTRGRGRGADRLWTGRQPVRLEPCKWEASTTAALIGAEVAPTMCIIAPSLPDPVFEFDQVSICDPAHLLAHIATDGPRTVDVAAVVERVTATFDATPEPHPSTPSPPPPAPSPPSAAAPRRAPRTRTATPTRPRSGRDRSWLRPVLTMTALLVALAVLPRLTPLITTFSTAVSDRLMSDLTPRPTPTPPPAGSLPTPPPAVPVEASCPTPGAGWVLSFGWPGDLPDGVSAYSIRSQPDGGPITRHDNNGWRDPSEQLNPVRVPSTTPLRIFTDFVDDAGRPVASTQDEFAPTEPC